MTDYISSPNGREKAAIEEQLRAVLASVLFAHAERLGRFLKFVVDETLGGRGDRITQYAIAMDVFDRDESFDPGIDAIVRVEAGRLRSKLLEYYGDIGGRDPIRIELPKRSYVATFRYTASGDNSRSSADEEIDQQSTRVVEATKAAPPRAPTIAVLPFVNISPDPEQDYFADGVTEDLITDLSNLPGIAVISRHSTFTYKNTNATVQQVCEELGANLVLEGSVRKFGDKLRITAQLIEGASGQHLWAERYDCDIDKIFDIQDEVNEEIVNACRLKLSDGERRNLKRQGTQVIDAYDYVLRGMKETDANTKEGSARARYCFETALELDSHYAVALARLALNYVFSWIQNWSRSAEDSLDKGRELALRAVAEDGQLAIAHAALCWAYLWSGEHDKAVAEGRIAVDLDPDDVLALERLAMSLIFSGDSEAGLPLIEKARRLNPNFSYDFVHGLAMFMMSNYVAAIEDTQRSFEQSPNFVPAGLYLAASQALLGNLDEAEAVVVKIRQFNPSYRLSEGFLKQMKITDDRERFLSGLRQAGLC